MVDGDATETRGDELAVLVGDGGSNGDFWPVGGNAVVAWCGEAMVAAVLSGRRQGGLGARRRGNGCIDGVAAFG